MRHVVFEMNIEDQPVLLNTENEMVRTTFRANEPEAVAFQQIVDRDLTLLLDLARAMHNGAFVERDRCEAEPGFVRHRLSRAAMDRACASSPSASASVMASGPISCSVRGVQDSSVVRFMKSSTESPDENRAVREVGRTWFGPAM